MLTEQEIYIAPRDNTFISLIRSVITKGNLKQKYIEPLLNEENMEIFSQVFTHKSVYTDTRPNYNYEVYEQLGDVSANKFIVWYMYKRFPQLNCLEGVKIVARLRINYGAKQSFYRIAENLGFWSFISASVEKRNTKMKNLLEDVFESFIGAIEHIIDNIFMVGVGYSIVYSILKNIFDEKIISLSYNNLYDSKTKLKELFDFMPSLGKLQYINKKIFTQEGISINCTEIYRNSIKIGEGSASLKNNAEQNASTNALELLKNEGYSKPVLPEYDILNKIK